MSEQDGERRPQCADQQDNDRDGLVDFPYDSGCQAAGDNSEIDLEVRPVCANGEDDDEDGIIDFPFDPGCNFAADVDEADPAFPPQCANGNDDDQNGRVDFPDDIGCAFAADRNERSDGRIPRRCADGVDNDADGLTDLADPGCVNALDNDETDPEVAAICNDGLDNDEDGAFDWPEDVGCAALGDECEQEGFGRCDDVCQPLQDNPLHCGRCGRSCAPGVECIDGRCGGVRDIVLMCGESVRYRPVDEFIEGEVAQRGLVGRYGCVPTPEVQAILVNTIGTNSVVGAAAAFRGYVEAGGQLITARSNTHTIVNASSV